MRLRSSSRKIHFYNKKEKKKVTWIVQYRRGIVPRAKNSRFHEGISCISRGHVCRLKRSVSLLNRGVRNDFAVCRPTYYDSSYFSSARKADVPSFSSRAHACFHRMRASPSTYALDRRAQREPNLHTESAMNSRLCDERKLFSLSLL